MMAHPKLVDHELWSPAPLAERGLLISWRGPGVRRVAAVRRLYAQLRQLHPAGIVDVVPGIESVLVCCDPLVLGPAEVWAALQPLLGDDGEDAFSPGALHRITMVYGGEEGPDLHLVAHAAGLSVDQVIALHTARPMPVLMVGFMPGFPYIGDLPPALRLPRRDEPRLHVQAGSVAISNDQTGIYPARSPGGWHVIGRTTAVLFDPGREPPALLQPGDRVQFESVARS